MNATRYESATAQGSSTQISKKNLKMEAGTQPDEAAVDQMSLYNHHLRTEVDLRRLSASVHQSKVMRFSEESNYNKLKNRKDQRPQSRKVEGDFYKRALGIEEARLLSIQKGGEILQRTDEGLSEGEGHGGDLVGDVHLDKLR